MKTCAFCQLQALFKEGRRKGKLVHVVPRKSPVVEVYFTDPGEVLDQKSESVMDLSAPRHRQIVTHFPNGVGDHCTCGLRGLVELLAQKLVKKLHRLIRYR